MHYDSTKAFCLLEQLQRIHEESTDLAPYSSALHQVQPYIPVTLWSVMKGLMFSRFATRAYYQTAKLQKNRLAQQQLKDQEARLLAALKLKRRQDAAALWGQWVANIFHRISGTEPTGRIFRSQLDTTIPKPVTHPYSKKQTFQPSTPSDYIDAEFSTIPPYTTPLLMSPTLSRDVSRIGKGKPGPGRGKRGSMLALPSPTAVKTPQLPSSEPGVLIGGTYFPLTRRQKKFL